MFYLTKFIFNKNRFKVFGWDLHDWVQVYIYNSESTY